jgi:molybdate transport system substrate-binding protein
MRHIASVTLLLLLAALPACGEEMVRLHAAGSLRPALTDLAADFTAATGIKVEAQFGASGLLRERLATGEASDVFASADLGNPRALHAQGKAGPVVLFARNRLCAVTRPGFVASTATLLEAMLDPAVKLATSTPRNDPAGDYAWEVFRKADAVHPGSRARLEAKALQLAGNDQAPAPPPGKGLYAWNLEAGRADVFLTYCTNGRGVVRELAGAAIVELPPALATGAEYGVTVLKGGNAAAALALLSYLLSPEGQAILRRHGFDAPLLPADSP